MEGANLFGNILLAFSALLNISLGALVLIQNRSSSINRRFFVLTISTALWNISNLLFFSLGDKYAYAMSLFSYSAAAFLALSFFMFCNSLSQFKFSPTYERTTGFLGVVFIALSALPGFIATGVTEELSIVTNEPALLTYGLVLVSFFITGLTTLILGLIRTKSNQDKAKIRIILLGLAVSAFIGVGLNLLLPMSGNYHFVQYGPVGALAFVAASTYAIVRHRLFDVRLAAIRTLAYLMTLSTLGAIYYFMAFAVSTLFLDSSTPVQPINIALALVLAFLFQPIKAFFDRITDNIFYRDNYEPNQFFADLNHILISTNNVHELSQKVSKFLVDNMRAERVCIYLDHGDEPIFEGNGNKKGMKQVGEDIYNAVVESGDVATCAVSQYQAKPALADIMKKHSLGLVLAMAHGDALVGVIYLGEKRNGNDYVKRDMTTLTTVSNELIIAIENALSVEEIQELNDTLQDRINIATKEIRANNKKLEKLDETKDEFISMASHQLRTPLTSIKGYVSMLLDGDAGKLTADQRRLLDEAYVSSERMVRLISDFLNVSRLQTGKFMLDKSKVNLGDLVTQELASLETIANAHDLKLGLKVRGPIPSLYVDEDKLRQVVMNFVDNAIYYSHEGSTIKVELRVEGGYLIYEVTDKGIGVPKEEQKHLFTRFFRAENARKQRPDGTGVGIYLAKKVITEHGGTIIFRSTENKGSTFGFRLPIRRLSLEENADNSVNNENDKSDNGTSN